MPLVAQRTNDSAALLDHFGSPNHPSRTFLARLQDQDALFKEPVKFTDRTRRIRCTLPHRLFALLLLQSRSPNAILLLRLDSLACFIHIDYFGSRYVLALILCLGAHDWLYTSSDSPLHLQSTASVLICSGPPHRLVCSDLAQDRDTHVAQAEGTTASPPPSTAKAGIYDGRRGPTSNQPSSTSTDAATASDTPPHFLRCTLRWVSDNGSGTAAAKLTSPCHRRRRVVIQTTNVIEKGDAAGEVAELKRFA
ncbi:hypothetical protein C8F01DRAFT_1370338 [Mycena amicta]|nr:hypothetical protein C8F01DRAFT_1370338 [Mycena amicta]